MAFTGKGRVGKFEYGYTGEPIIGLAGRRYGQWWIVRNRETGEIIAKAQNQSDAATAAARAHYASGG